MGKARSYDVKFADAKTRVLEFLRSSDAEARAVRVTDIRRYLHGTAGEALIAPVLVTLEYEGAIEVIENARGAVVYLRVADAGDTK